MLITNSDIIQGEDVLVSQNFPLISKKLSILHLGWERNLYSRGNLRHVEPLQTKQISDNLVPFFKDIFFHFTLYFVLTKVNVSWELSELAVALNGNTIALSPLFWKLSQLMHRFRQLPCQVNVHQLWQPRLYSN